jgi:hypothetical protein
MKLSPQNIGHQLGKVSGRVSSLEEKYSLIEADNAELLEAVNTLKDIIDNMLVKDNPLYRKKSVLDEMGGFLRKPIGRTRTIIPDQG